MSIYGIVVYDFKYFEKEILRLRELLQNAEKVKETENENDR